MNLVYVTLYRLLLYCTNFGHHGGDAMSLAGGVEISYRPLGVVIFLESKIRNVTLETLGKKILTKRFSKK